MTPLLLSVVVAGALAPCAAPPLPARAPALAEEVIGARLIDTLGFGRFGPVVLYRPRAHPSQVVLFVSGDGGWNHGVVDMARQVARQDALVVGIDMRRYLAALARAPGGCGYPAADFEALSQWVQRRLDFPSYTPPALVGYSSGALVYAILVQAPPGTFRGAISLGFCSDLALHRPLCRGAGLAGRPGPRGRGIVLQPAESVAAPWIVLQGEADSTCPPSAAEAYVRRVRNAALVPLPRVGHGFAVPARWAPALRDALARLGPGPAGSRPPPAPAVRDLPLVELPAHGGTGALAVIVSGDGGWASLDRRVGETFAARGLPVVGLNSLQYFWRRRTPDGAGADLARVIRHYLEAWHARDLVLVGYSRGADVLPFMVSRLPADLRRRIRVVALLSPGRTAGFQFHLADWLPGPPHGDVVPTGPEIAKLRGLRVLCVYGTGDDDAVCPALRAGLVTRMPRRGGHHIGGGYRELAGQILEAGGLVSNSGSDRPGSGP